jgi:4-hydroxythreonine-4-phosphate dehydrogenase
MSKLPILGISIGDVNSVAVEVIIKALADTKLNEYCCPVVYGSPKIISYWKKAMGMHDFNLNIIKSTDQVHYKKSNILVCWEEEVDIKPGEANATGGKYALRSLEMATRDLKEGRIHALVTAPLNKNTVNSEAQPFQGHTEYLAQAAGTSDYLMLLLSSELKVGLVTGHVPLKDVASRISPELIVKKIKLMNESLRNDFGIVKPKIAVLGLNPHAGDSGLLGKEEQEIIIPAVETAKAAGVMVSGPYPSDGFFGARQYRKFDGVIAMYHDQGLIPFKYFAFSDGVNYTAGLPFVRTSPDHGTAYNIAGKNQADESSFRNAIYVALDILSRKKMHADITANPLPFTPLKRERFRMDF